jgi:zinc transporter ZupT
LESGHNVPEEAQAVMEYITSAGGGEGGAPAGAAPAPEAAGAPMPPEAGEAGEGLFTGILFHNIPISFTLVNIFLMSGKTHRQTLTALIIFALMTPLGALVSGFIPGDPEVFGHYALALVIGIFFHISTTILFEADQNHRFNLMKFATILLGSAAAFLLH